MLFYKKTPFFKLFLINMCIQTLIYKKGKPLNHVKNINNLHATKHIHLATLLTAQRPFLYKSQPIAFVINCLRREDKVVHHSCPAHNHATLINSYLTLSPWRITVFNSATTNCNPLCPKRISVRHSLIANAITSCLPLTT